MCNKIKEAYAEYNIQNLSYGEKGDKLGDAYESFVVNVFNDINYIIEFNNLSNSKTDVLVKVYKRDGQIINIPISIKQTTVAKVAMAEYSVDTILNETGINNTEVERLMKKHQKDASAINFSREEKETLKRELERDNNKYKLLRWILTMSPLKNNSDIRIPRYIIKFQLDKKSLEVKELGIYNIDEYINHISVDKKGSPSRCGFGTGLSWTYATGSKGKRIQFKG